MVTTLELALGLLRVLRGPGAIPEPLSLRDDALWLGEERVPTVRGLAPATARILLTVQLELLSLSSMGPEQLLDALRDAQPCSAMELMGRLRREGPERSRPCLSPMLQRLLSTQAVGARSGSPVPAAFVDWLRRIQSDALWRYADPPPIPGAKPLPLDDAWVELCVVEPEELFALRQGRPLTMDEMQWRAEPTSWVLERLRGVTVVLGDPGAGKTTLLRWMARQTVVNSTVRPFLPLFVSLRSYVDALLHRPSLSLIEHFVEAECLGDRHVLDWLMQLQTPNDVPLLGLLDGWDEVPADCQDLVAHAIQVFSGIIPMVVLTSRRSGYPSRIPHQDIFVLTELGDEGVDALVRKSCELAGRPNLADELLLELRRHEDLLRMAKNPFLLSLVCGLALSEGSSSIAACSRVELYRRTLELIRHHHNTRHLRGSRPFDEAAMQHVDAFALSLMGEGPSGARYVFSSREVQDTTAEPTLFDTVLKPARLFKKTHLIEDRYAFLHATFQEFCAARALVESSDSLERALRTHGLSGAWREVFRFVAALQPQQAGLWWAMLRDAAGELDRFGVLAIRLADFLSEVRVADGGRFLLGVDLRAILWAQLEGVLVAGPVLEAYRRLDARDLVARLVAAFERAEPKSEPRAELLRLLGKIPEASSFLIDVALNGDLNDSSIARLAVAPILDTCARQRLRTMLDEPELEVGRAKRVIQMLSNARDAASVQRLARLIDARPDLHEDCIRALGRIGGDDSLAVLARLSEDDTAPELNTVFDALAATKSPRGRDLLLWHLLRKVESGADDEALVNVLEALTELPIHRAAAMLIHLLRHPSPMVRRGAVWALSHATESPVVDALISIADTDPEEEVRSDALAVLQTRITPGRADWLLAQWTNPVSPRARADALTAFLLLVGRTPDGPERERLRILAAEAVCAALTDPSEDVALAAAMHGFVAGPQVAEPLCSAMAEREGLREYAISTLAQLGHQPAIPILMPMAGAVTGSASDEAFPEIDVGVRVAQRAAAALAALDPHALFRVSGPIAKEALAREARRRQWLVYEDRIQEEWPGSAIRLRIGRDKDSAESKPGSEAVRRLAEAAILESLASPRGGLARQATQEAYHAGTAVITRLRQVASDVSADPWVREAACHSLAELGDSGAVPIEGSTAMEALVRYSVENGVWLFPDQPAVAAAERSAQDGRDTPACWPPGCIRIGPWEARSADTPPGTAQVPVQVLIDDEEQCVWVGDQRIELAPLPYWFFALLVGAKGKRLQYKEHRARMLEQVGRMRGTDADKDEAKAFCFERRRNFLEELHKSARESIATALEGTLDNLPGKGYALLDRGGQYEFVYYERERPGDPG